MTDGVKSCYHFCSLLSFSLSVAGGQHYLHTKTCLCFSRPSCRRTLWRVPDSQSGDRQDELEGEDGRTYLSEQKAKGLSHAIVTGNHSNVQQVILFPGDESFVSM